MLAQLSATFFTVKISFINLKEFVVLLIFFIHLLTSVKKLQIL